MLEPSSQQRFRLAVLLQLIVNVRGRQHGGTGRRRTLIAIDDHLVHFEGGGRMPRLLQRLAAQDSRLGNQGAVGMLLQQLLGKSPPIVRLRQPLPLEPRQTRQAAGRVLRCLVLCASSANSVSANAVLLRHATSAR